MKNKNLIAYFGHHKCATTWMNIVNAQVCEELGLRFANVYNPNMFQHHLSHFVRTNAIDFLAYTSANFTFVKDLKDFVGFHIIRDPRDIVVSAYFSHLYSHPTNLWPELVAHRERLKHASKAEGLFIEMEFRKQEFETLYHWDYSLENMLEIKMENLIRAPYETLIKVYSFLGLLDDPRHYSVKAHVKFLVPRMLNKLHARTNGAFPFTRRISSMPVENLLGILYRNRFSAVSAGRHRGEEDQNSHYRKGVAGDWINHFTPEHIRVFKQQYNELLFKLGYETREDWDVPPESGFVTGKILDNGKKQ